MQILTPKKSFDLVSFMIHLNRPHSWLQTFWNRSQCGTGDRSASPLSQLQFHTFCAYILCNGSNSCSLLTFRLPHKEGSLPRILCNLCRTRWQNPCSFCQDTWFSHRKSPSEGAWWRYSQPYPHIFRVSLECPYPQASRMLWNILCSSNIISKLPCCNRRTMQQECKFSWDPCQVHNRWVSEQFWGRT